MLLYFILICRWVIFLERFCLGNKCAITFSVQKGTSLYAFYWCCFEMGLHFQDEIQYYSQWWLMHKAPNKLTVIVIINTWYYSILWKILIQLIGLMESILLGKIIMTLWLFIQFLFNLLDVPSPMCIFLEVGSFIEMFFHLLPCLHLFNWY